MSHAKVLAIMYLLGPEMLIIGYDKLSSQGAHHPRSIRETLVPLMWQPTWKAPGSPGLIVYAGTRAASSRA